MVGTESDRRRKKKKKKNNGRTEADRLFPVGFCRCPPHAGRSPIADFGATSADGNLVIVHAGSDADPGTLLAAARRGGGSCSPRRGWRSGLRSPTCAVSPIRPPTACRSPCDLPPGREARGLPSCCAWRSPTRDEWASWLAFIWRIEGYAVLQPNFRGSTGYGDAWFGQNGFKAWKIAVGDVNDAGRWLVSEGIADPAKLSILGWSYGGYAALQSQVIDTTLYKAVVAVAPVTDLGVFASPAGLTRTSPASTASSATGDAYRRGQPGAPRGRLRGAGAAVPRHARPECAVRSVYTDERAGSKSRRKPVTYVEFDNRDHQIDDAGRAQDAARNRHIPGEFARALNRKGRPRGTALSLP